MKLQHNRVLRFAGGTELRGLSLDSILQSSLSAPLEGPAAQASADLLLSCIHGKPDPAVQLATILQQLVEMPSDYTADATANIASAVSEITGKADAGDNAEATEQQADAAPHPGQVLALLLVQQLLSSLQQASQVLQWQCDELDALACQLVDMHSRSSPEVSRKYSQAGAQQQTGSDASGLAAVAENVASAALSGDAASSGNEAGQIKPSSGHQEPHMPQTAPGGGSMLGDMEEWHKQLQKKLELERQPAHLELPTFDDTGYPSAQLLGLLIKGKGTTSLLSDAVVQKILSQLQEALRQSGTEHSHSRDICYSLRDCTVSFTAKLDMHSQPVIIYTVASIKHPRHQLPTKACHAHPRLCQLLTHMSPHFNLSLRQNQQQYQSCRSRDCPGFCDS